MEIAPAISSPSQLPQILSENIQADDSGGSQGKTAQSPCFGQLFDRRAGIAQGERLQSETGSSDLSQANLKGASVSEPTKGESRINDPFQGPLFKVNNSYSADPFKMTKSAPDGTSRQMPAKPAAESELFAPEKAETSVAGSTVQVISVPETLIPKTRVGLQQNLVEGDNAKVTSDAFCGLRTDGAGNLQIPRGSASLPETARDLPDSGTQGGLPGGAQATGKPRGAGAEVVKTDSRRAPLFSVGNLAGNGNFTASLPGSAGEVQQQGNPQLVNNASSMQPGDSLQTAAGSKTGYLFKPAANAPFSPPLSGTSFQASGGNMSALAGLQQNLAEGVNAKVTSDAVAGNLQIPRGSASLPETARDLPGSGTQGGLPGGAQATGKPRGAGAEVVKTDSGRAPLFSVGNQAGNGNFTASLPGSAVEFQQQGNPHLVNNASSMQPGDSLQTAAGSKPGYLFKPAANAPFSPPLSATSFQASGGNMSELAGLQQNLVEGVNAKVTSDAVAGNLQIPRGSASLPETARDLPDSGTQGGLPGGAQATGKPRGAGAEVVKTDSGRAPLFSVGNLAGNGNFTAYLPGSAGEFQQQGNPQLANYLSSMQPGDSLQTAAGSATGYSFKDPSQVPGSPLSPGTLSQAAISKAAESSHDSLPPSGKIGGDNDITMKPGESAANPAANGDIQANQDNPSSRTMGIFSDAVDISLQEAEVSSWGAEPTNRMQNLTSSEPAGGGSHAAQTEADQLGKNDVSSAPVSIPPVKPQATTDCTTASAGIATDQVKITITEEPGANRKDQGLSLPLESREGKTADIATTPALAANPAELRPREKAALRPPHLTRRIPWEII
jgi:hypothetical protein